MATGRETDAGTAESEQPKDGPAPATPRRRRRRKSPAAAATPATPAATASPRPARSTAARSTATPSARTRLTIEAIVAVEPPREFRLHPRDRVVAYTAEAAGARQLFTLPLRGGYRDPADRVGEGRRRPAVVARRPSPRVRPRRRDLGRRGRRSRRDVVVAEPGRRSCPRWSPDGHRLAFLSPPPRLVPGLARSTRRSRAAAGRHASRSRRSRAPLTATGVDVEDFVWSPDGRADRGHGRSGRRTSTMPARSHLVDVATGDERRGRRRAEHRVGGGPRGCRTVRLLYVSDADGWFQVVRLTADGHDRIVLTSGRARARRADRRRSGSRRCPSPDGSAVRPRRGPRRPPVDLRRRASSAVHGRRSAAAAARRRPPRTVVAAADRPGGSTRGTASGEPVGWLPDGAWVAAIGESETRAAGPVAAAGAGRRAGRRAAAPGHGLDCRPSSRAALAPARVPTPASASRSRPATGSRIEGTLWRPADGDRQARRHAASRRSSTRTAARPGRPSARSMPFKQLLVARGLRVPRRRLPRLDRLRPRRSATPTTTSGATPTSHDLIDAARWAAEQPWSRRPAGDLRRLVRRLPGAVRARRGARRCGGPASTCTATRRSPRATATATGSAGSTSQDDGLARRPGARPRSTGAARRSIARSGSRRRC